VGWTSQVARQVVVDGSGAGDGIFVYDGAPMLGNLIVSVTAEAGVDQYGNVYPQGLFVAAGVIEGGTFVGDDFIINPAGIFVYDGTPATGNLIASITAAPGTDQFGNTYPRGYGLWQANQVTGNEFNLLTGAASEKFPAQLYTFVDSPGTGLEQMQVNLQSAENTAIGDRVLLALLSATANLAQPNAIGELGYIKAGSTSIVPMLSWGPGGIFAIGTTNAAAPGASPSSPAVVETFHNITLDSGWSVTVQPQYRLLPFGDVEVLGQITRAGTTSAVNINSSHPIPSDYWPPTGVTRIYRSPAAGDNAGTVSITPTGVFQMRASGFSASVAIMDGIYAR
jgi:hypothetical protein